MPGMRRRQFVSLFGGAAAWPLAARAQQPAMPVVGLLHNSSHDRQRDFVAAFRSGLARAGYFESRNLAIEYRWGENDRLPALAADLIHRQVDVIAAVNTPTVLAAKAATQTVPIVFLIGTDPVELGLVASLARPGGNVTGFTTLNTELFAKRLEVLHELVPAAKSIAFLVNPSSPQVTEGETKLLQIAARVLGVGLLIVNASGENEFDAAFATISGERAGALLVSADTLFRSDRNRCASGSARNSYVVPIPSDRGGGRSYELRSKFFGSVAGSGSLHWPNSQRREAGRPAGTASHQVRAGDQSQDREGARPHHSRRRCSLAPTR